MLLSIHNEIRKALRKQFEMGEILVLKKRGMTKMEKWGILISF